MHLINKADVRKIAQAAEASFAVAVSAICTVYAICTTMDLFVSMRRDVQYGAVNAHTAEELALALAGGALAFFAARTVKPVYEEFEQKRDSLKQIPIYQEIEKKCRSFKQIRKLCS